MSLVIARTYEIKPNTPFIFSRGEEDFFAISTTFASNLILEFDDGRVIRGDSHLGHYYTMYKCEFAWQKATRCTIKDGVTGGIVTYSGDMYVYYLKVAK